MSTRSFLLTMTQIFLFPNMFTCTFFQFLESCVDIFHHSYRSVCFSPRHIPCPRGSCCWGWRVADQPGELPELWLCSTPRSSLKANFVFPCGEVPLTSRLTGQQNAQRLGEPGLGGYFWVRLTLGCTGLGKAVDPRPVGGACPTHPSSGPGVQAK